MGLSNKAYLPITGFSYYKSTAYNAGPMCSWFRSNPVMSIFISSNCKYDTDHGSGRHLGEGGGGGGGSGGGGGGSGGNYCSYCYYCHCHSHSHSHPLGNTSLYTRFYMLN